MEFIAHPPPITIPHLQHREEAHKPMGMPSHTVHSSLYIVVVLFHQYWHVTVFLSLVSALLQTFPAFPYCFSHFSPPRGLVWKGGHGASRPLLASAAAFRGEAFRDGLMAARRERAEPHHFPSAARLAPRSPLGTPRPVPGEGCGERRR